MFDHCIDTLTLTPDTLCKACKLINDQFGRWQGNNEPWREQWNSAFRESGIKRRIIANFTPNHW